MHSALYALFLLQPHMHTRIFHKRCFMNNVIVKLTLNVSVNIIYTDLYILILYCCTIYDKNITLLVPAFL